MTGIRPSPGGETMTWTFLSRGGADGTPTSFDVTVDGPVEEVDNVAECLIGKAAELAPEARSLCHNTLGHVRQLVEGTKNGKRRFSMNLSGGLGVQGAWTLRMDLNLAEDPEAK